MHRLFSRRPDLRAEFAALEGRGVAPERVQRLADHFATADERGLTYLNPRLIGEALGLEDRETLRLLLAALALGLVTLHWDVRCPRCGATDHRADSLSALRHEQQCPVCTAVHACRLDDEVRVSFSLVERLHPRPAVDDPVQRSLVDARLGSLPGHSLLLLPEFQQLFPQQRLLPDESLDVTRAALLFTDLAGSTAIYARRGDPRAYHLVRLHFNELFRVADECGGLMVKTIGDAVMAAFELPRQALRAAIAMQEAIIALNERSGLQGEEQLILKVGLHTGPCLSVTLNDRPDYFGSTVNIAARVQGLAKGGDIVLTDAVREDAEARGLLEGRRLESGTVRLRGIDEPVLVHRLVASFQE